MERWDTSSDTVRLRRRIRLLKVGQKVRKDSQKQRVTVSLDDNSDTNSEICGLVKTTDCALSIVNEWIIDSGATSHMCCNKEAFTTFYQLEDTIKVTVGDGRALTAIGRGDEVLNVEQSNAFVTIL